MAILLLASVGGYEAVVHRWKKNQTVKAISELVVRYKLQPITPKDKKVNSQATAVYVRVKYKVIWKENEDIKVNVFSVGNNMYGFHLTELEKENKYSDWKGIKLKSTGCTDSYTIASIGRDNYTFGRMDECEGKGDFKVQLCVRYRYL